MNFENTLPNFIFGSLLFLVFSGATTLFGTDQKRPEVPKASPAFAQAPGSARSSDEPSEVEEFVFQDTNLNSSRLSSLSSTDRHSQHSQNKHFEALSGFIRGIASSENQIAFPFFLLTWVLLNRWFLSGHPPFSNLYESLLFLTWMFLFFALGTSTNLFSQMDSKTSAPESSEIKPIDSEKAFHDLLRFLFLTCSLFFYTFATWLLPSDMQRPESLVPALQSNWLLMHVSIMLVSYASLFAGSLCSMTYLVVLSFLKTQTLFDESSTENQNRPSDVRARSNQSTFLNGETMTLLSPVLPASERSSMLRKTQDEASTAFAVDTRPGSAHNPEWTDETRSTANQLLQSLDYYSYRTLSIGFPLLTLGIISGAVWANEAWGSYWSWDPKETWAFITWLVFAVYLHIRLNEKWVGEKAAYVSTFGFFVLWLCYLGVNLLGKGLHSYGWW